MSDCSVDLLHVEVEPREANECTPGARQLGETPESGGMSISAAAGPIPFQQRPPIGSFVIVWIEKQSIPEKSRSVIVVTSLLGKRG